MKTNCTLFLIVWALSTSCNVSNHATTSFEYYAGLIFLEIQINEGDTLFAILDTGAEISAVDSRTSEALKLPTIGSTQIAGTNAIIDADVVRMTDLRLDQHAVDSIFPTKRDLTHSLSPNNRKLDLILGYDFFENAIVEINFPKRELTVRRDASELDNESFIPFSLDHNIPRFTGMVNGKIEMDFRLDTGASLFETDDIYVNITTSDWKRIKEEYPTLTPESYLSATGINNEEITLPVVRLEKITVDRLTIDKPYVIIQPELGYYALPDAVGFVSNNLLRTYDHIAIDYVNRRLYYSKPEAE